VVWIHKHGAMSSPWKEEQEATPRISTPLSPEAFAEDLFIVCLCAAVAGCSRGPGVGGERVETVALFGGSASALEKAYDLAE
jgi:hypothetical protein